MARRTAVLRLGEVGPPGELRALDVQREYPFELTIDGRVVAAGSFSSPLGDQGWRDAATRTERKTLPAIEGLLQRASARRIVRAPEGAVAAMVHVEAHGDPEKGTIELERADFLDTQRSATMVLLWSCVSNLMQPWGESLAMKLHRQANRLVLGFTTPVREDTAGDLARRFYDAVFEGQI